MYDLLSVRVSQECPDAHPGAGYFSFVNYLKAALLVKWNVLFVLGFKVAGQASSVGPRESRLHQSAADALSMPGRVHAQDPQIPVRSGYDASMKRIGIALCGEEARESRQAKPALYLYEVGENCPDQPAEGGKGIAGREPAGRPIQGWGCVDLSIAQAVT